MIESLEKFVKWKQTPCDPVTCRMHPDHKHEQEVEEKKEDNNNNG